MNDLTFWTKPMLGEHISVVTALAKATHELQTGTSAPVFYSDETLQRWIRSPHAATFVAEVEGEKRICGFVLASYNPDTRDGYIHAIAVHHEYRRFHIGFVLLRKALDRLEDLGSNHVFCVTRVGNEGTKRFFLSSGFENAGKYYYLEKIL